MFTRKFTVLYWFFGLLFIGLFAGLVHAQVALPPGGIPYELPAPPTGEEIKAFIASIGGLKGLGALGIVAIIVQALMLLTKTAFANILGKWQLTLVYLFTLGGGIFVLKTTGLDWMSVFLHSTTLAALQVFVNQIIRQFFPKTAPLVKA